MRNGYVNYKININWKYTNYMKRQRFYKKSLTV